MNNSKIKINPESGRPSLTVYYDASTDNYDSEIQKAMDSHNVIEGWMNVIAVPLSLKSALYGGDGPC
jgi:hypothetical protein